jgi:hypothetical protein
VYSSPSGLVGRCQRFGEKYCLHLQGFLSPSLGLQRRVDWSSEYGDSMFLRKVVIYLQVHTALQPRRPTSASSPPWEPQISYSWFII